MRFKSLSITNIRPVSLVVIAALGMSSQAAHAIGTAAGTQINNTATASYNNGATTVDVPSNPNTIIVDELIDVAVAWPGPNTEVAPGQQNQALKYTVTNTGNGTEAYALDFSQGTATDNFDPVPVKIYIDSDGDGVFNPANDQEYIKGSNDPVLAADGSVTVFVVSNIPGGLNDLDRGGVKLTATSTTLAGTAALGNPGQSVTNPADPTYKAVAGASGGTANADGFYAVKAATVALVKSATVVDPFSPPGTTVVPGSIITYTLVATTTGSGIVPALVISDAVPTGTEYVPGSITLENVTQTDAADSADTSSFANNKVTVDLGNVAGQQTRTVTFKVKVKLTQ